VKAPEVMTRNSVLVLVIVSGIVSGKTSIYRMDRIERMSRLTGRGFIL
jgi:hypothetical protein